MISRQVISWHVVCRGGFFWQTALGFTLLLLMILGSLASPSAYGCSSCGTGGDDPLILYPSDTNRFYLGMTRTVFSKAVTSQGNDTAVLGVRRRDRLVMAIAERFSARVFFGIALPYIVNFGANSASAGLGDPSFTGRYTIVQQNFAQPGIPQLQVLGGFKPGLAPAIWQALDQQEYLDAFGTGHDEFRVGLDLWQGLSTLQYGAGYNLVYSRPTKVESVRVLPGLKQTLNLTGGVSFNATKVLAGLTQTRVAAPSLDGQQIAIGGALQNSLFATIYYQLDLRREFRLTYLDAGAFGPQRQTTKSSNWTAAYMRSF